MILDGCDAFLFNILKALTKNTSIQELRLISESFVVLRIAHSQCLHLWMMWAVNSVPITSFGSTRPHIHTHTHARMDTHSISTHTSSRPHHIVCCYAYAVNLNLFILERHTKDTTHSQYCLTFPSSAEVYHFQHERVVDFKAMMQGLLEAQIKFYQEVRHTRALQHLTFVQWSVV